MAEKQVQAVAAPEPRVAAAIVGAIAVHQAVLAAAQAAGLAAERPSAARVAAGDLGFWARSGMAPQPGGPLGLLRRS
jgi:hypothetical protein